MLIFVIAFSLVLAEPHQSIQCGLCRQIFTALISQIGEVVSEDQVESYLRFGCSTFGLDSWCQTNVYPNTHDIFLALRSNKTDDIICERIGLCHFKVISITGDILFAEQDQLYTIKELPGGQIEWTIFGKVEHPSLPTGIICGLSCSEDYCAVLLSSTDTTTGVDTYGTVALSQYGYVDQLLPKGFWYGPWNDIITDEFWMATGSSRDYTFGIYDPQYGDWEPKVYVHLPRARADSEILSGQILDRVLYFTLRLDPHIYYIDLSLRLFRGNFSSPNDTMLVGNPLTNELYGYSPSPNGIWKYTLTTGNRTTIVSINLASAEAVPSSTINPIDNTLWVSLWGSGQDAWLKVDLKKTTNNVEWAPTGDLDGLFDFNPYEIISEEA